VLIAAVWNTEHDFKRFLHDKLLASVRVEGGFSGEPEQRAAEIADLQTA
jgi:hypothetical protein